MQAKIQINNGGAFCSNCHEDLLFGSSAQAGDRSDPRNKVPSVCPKCGAIFIEIETTSNK